MDFFFYFFFRISSAFQWISPLSKVAEIISKNVLNFSFCLFNQLLVNPCKFVKDLDTSLIFIIEPKFIGKFQFKSGLN